MNHVLHLLNIVNREYTVLRYVRYRKLVRMRRTLINLIWSDDSVGHRTLGGEDRSIPTLREVYQEFPELPINVDIKINNDDLIRKVISYLLRHLHSPV